MGLRAPTSTPSPSPRGAVVLGHGAGGGVSAPDLLAATDASLAAQFTVVLVEQPYRVAGRQSPAPAHQLDAAWLAVVDHLRTVLPAGLPLVTGGRSSGRASRAAPPRPPARPASSASPSRSSRRAAPAERRRRAGSPSSTRSPSPRSSSRA